MSSPHTQKTRHYAALAARLQTLKSNLDETDKLMGNMSAHLGAMRGLAAANAAQFMAASRNLDLELIIRQQAAEVAAAAGVQDADTEARTP